MILAGHGILCCAVVNIYVKLLQLLPDGSQLPHLVQINAAQHSMQARLIAGNIDMCIADISYTRAMVISKLLP